MQSLRARAFTIACPSTSRGHANLPKRNLRAREAHAGTFMSLEDSIFDGMFHGDGGARVTGTCFCGADTSDADEAQCRRCLQDEPSVFGPDSPLPPTSGEVKDMGVRLVAAAAASAVPPGWNSRASTPPARAVPLQTAAGTLSPHIPLVIVSPRPMTETQPLAGCSSRKKELKDRIQDK